MRGERFLILCATALLLGALRTLAGLPDYFKLPESATVVAETLVEEVYGEANFPVVDSDAQNVKRGHHYSAELRMSGVSDDALWPPLRSALEGAGWTVAKFFDLNPPSATLRYQKGPLDAWASITMFGADDIRLQLVEVKAYTPTLTFIAPAAMPETIAAEASFPYLSPPNRAPTATDAEAGPLYVTFKGDQEPTLIATTSVRKDYATFEGVSRLQFMEDYRSALTKAGWQIVEASQALNQSDAVLAAHYARAARDIWAVLHFTGELTVSVADLSGDLAAKLQKECHLPLYGITFEFNKATIRPESESTLQRVAALLQQQSAMNVEVQGHTDNVGGDAYNLTLSQSRADAVKSWLSGHGVPAARITSKGYGRNQPIADNGTSEGRAKNRRVELAVAGCTR